ncbi:hypothetical protein SAMN04487764_2961 [Gillisia sp. Hel1_33_143]|uniref:mobilization protein MbpA n=1 Tax=Gillisia sp. Hel1_33_143 TaxID=1336796 RepID=UPI000879708E|nr:mobilization protein MbpA [Gillisia sp. Hel1_33_143]SDS74869.1 hypothetical protein SAMN04487764_2961 [Gillisia sp. Hel1_33_143]
MKNRAKYKTFLKEKNSTSQQMKSVSAGIKFREKIIDDAEITEQNEKELSISTTNLESNSRCVPVGTILISPDGRNEKKRFKGKSDCIKFRCSIYEKKLLKIKAKNSGLTISEFCRRAVFEKEIKERLSEDLIEIYKTLVKFHNNFKSIGNMFRKKDPKLTKEVYQLANEIKNHLKNVKK